MLYYSTILPEDRSSPSEIFAQKWEESPGIDVLAKLISLLGGPMKGKMA